MSSYFTGQGLYMPYVGRLMDAAMASIAQMGKLRPGSIKDSTQVA